MNESSYWMLQQLQKLSFILTNLPGESWRAACWVMLLSSPAYVHTACQGMYYAANTFRLQQSSSFKAMN